jgi:hypothetical protein
MFNEINMFDKMPRQAYCTVYLNKVMPLAVGKLLISNSKTEIKLAKMVLTDIKNRILNEFKNKFSDENNNQWMDEKSKTSSLLKANKIESFIGYDEFLFNNTFMNHLYDVIKLYFFFLRIPYLLDSFNIKSLI